MVSSTAATVQEYLNALSPESKEIILTLRNLILANLPDGYVETMNWGMISYEVPLARYPKTYNKKPLMFAALAAQKNHYALYLSGVYRNPLEAARIQEGFSAAGKKLDMGKSCIRFHSLEQLALPVIAQAVAATSLETFLIQYEQGLEMAKSTRNHPSAE
jgi:hypothetical protein